MVALATKPPPIIGGYARGYPELRTSLAVQQSRAAVRRAVGPAVVLYFAVFGENVRICHGSRVEAGELPGLNRDELYVNPGCLRERAQVAGI